MLGPHLIQVCQHCVQSFAVCVTRKSGVSKPNMLPAICSSVKLHTLPHAAKDVVVKQQCDSLSKHAHSKVEVL